MDGHLAGSGAQPHDPGMEARVAVLEQIASDLRESQAAILKELGRLNDRVSQLSDRVSGVSERVAELSGRVSQLPSTWLLVTTIVASQTTLAGLVFAAIKLAH